VNFSGKLAATNGGGMYLRGINLAYGGGGNIFEIDGAVFDDNEAGYDGGGIYVDSNTDSPVEIFGSTSVTNNTADHNGGGIYMPYAKLDLLDIGADVIFSSNSASIRQYIADDDQTLYDAHVLVPSLATRWSIGDNGYNNYDISYVPIVKYNKNGGTGTMTSTAAAVALKANEFVNGAKQFTGWSETATGSVAYADEYVLTVSDITGSILELFAIWRDNKGTEDEFGVDNSEVIGADNFSYNVLSGSLSNVLTKSLSGVAATDAGGDAIDTADITPNAAQLAAINAKILAHQTGTFDLAFTTLGGTLVTVKVNLTIPSYTVKFADHDGRVISTNTVVHGTATTAPGNPSWDHHVFTGWDKTFDNVTEHLTVTANYIWDSHTVTYHSNEATSDSVLAAETYTHGSEWIVAAQGNLARSGYTFRGWALSPRARAATYNSGDKNTLTDDVHLYAVWSYNGGGGGSTIPEPEEPPIDPPDIVTPPIDPPIDPPVTPESVEGRLTTGAIAMLTEEGFSDDEIQRMEAQTGNIFVDIAAGNVPLGNIIVTVPWSLLSLILSLVAVIISVLLMVGIFLRRKNGKDGDEEQNATYREDGKEEGEEKRSGGGIMRVLTVIAGILTPIVWLILDDLTQPIVWINKWTIVVALVFVLHLIFLFVYKARKADRKN
jgi:predicted outer membrane repeat protein